MRGIGAEIRAYSAVHYDITNTQTEKKKWQYHSIKTKSLFSSTFKVGEINVPLFDSFEEAVNEKFSYLSMTSHTQI